jgi:transcriptional regulator with XRE-family HTH domain
MIPPSVVQEIRRLLAEGRLSYRRIAKLAGVSRGSVSLIASGKRPDYKPREEPAADVPAGPPERCPTCGALVYMPCRLCRLRAFLTRLKSSLGRHPDGPPDPIVLELSEEHRARYEEVRFGATRPQTTEMQLEEVS